MKPIYRGLMDSLETLGVPELRQRWQTANDRASMDSFTFLLDPKEFRTVPTDWIPRLIPAHDWDTIASGVAQRLKAINKFLKDLYCGQQNIVPPDVMFSNRPARDAGVDAGLRHHPLRHQGCLPGDVRPRCDTDAPTCVLLTDSKYGAAFFEHRYLSELLGITLVEGSDLYIGPNGRVLARAMGGDFEVDLIYRRIEDLELFVPGLTEAYLNHKVALVNALGAGAGDDKLVFLWVPDMIRDYLGETPILEQAVSYDLRSAENRQYVLQNLECLVLKTRQGYGGLGVFIMPDLGLMYRNRLAQQLIEQPQVFIAQETLDFSQHLVFDDSTAEFGERYVDLRVFAIQNGTGEVTVFPGGLTRVSEPASRVTNNSSGGSFKPSWVIR